MRALTICQPWAELIVSGEKRIENRSWPTSFRGHLAIHAGKSRKYFSGIDADAWARHYGVRMPLPGECVFGAIVGVAEVIACVPLGDLAKEFPELAGSRFAEGPICWVLANARRIESVACAGQLSLWTTDLVTC